MANPSSIMQAFKTSTSFGSEGGRYPLDIQAPHESNFVTFSAFTREPYFHSNDNAGTSPGTQEAIGGSVMLYIPEGISVGYGTNWNQKDLGIAGQDIINLIAENGGNRAAAMSQMMDENGSVRKLLKEKGAGAAGQFVGIDNGVDILNYGSRSVSNANPRMLFEGVGFRQFNFNYSFVPRNALESIAVRNIIHYFKLYMHPTVTEAVINYPAEFKIAYGGNQYLHNFKPAALVDMKVEYAVNGVWSSFQLTKAPTEVRMSLSFQETEFITRADVMNENV